MLTPLRLGCVDERCATGLSAESDWEFPDPFSNLIAYPAIDGQYLCFILKFPCQCRWVRKALMDDPGSCGPVRAGFMRMAADRHHIVKWRQAAIFIAELLKLAAGLAGDINSTLSHDRHCPGVKPMSFESCAFTVPVRMQAAHETKCHLAATGVTGAEEEDGRHGEIIDWQCGDQWKISAQSL